jgi:hypothetical protein
MKIEHGKWNICSLCRRGLHMSATYIEMAVILLAVLSGPTGAVTTASGTAGLVFLEDEASASGEFRWATAASSRIINGDVNFDGDVNGLDVDPFVTAVLGGDYIAPADMNGDGSVDGLDVDPFVAAVVGGGTQQVPEPSTLLLALVALGVVGGWRKWGG